MLMILFIRMMIWKQVQVMYYVKKNEGKKKKKYGLYMNEGLTDIF